MSYPTNRNAGSEDQGSGNHGNPGISSRGRSLSFSTGCENTPGEPPYVGRNFEAGQRGLSASFAYGDVQTPQASSEYVSRPEVWPADVASAYHLYKHVYGLLFEESCEDLEELPSKSQPGQWDDWTLRRGVFLAGRRIYWAKEESVARSGFEQKFPWAYESIGSRESHEKQANQKKRSAKNLRDFQRRMIQEAEHRGLRVASKKDIRLCYGNAEG
ncbi:hypothetical protein P170DRAFT_480687 [Aspergillus steynii IBT 23096]|uniref:Uncharacterized protein n=1 Tax=Aspergillus steynii IBT 23096 TaxID=1392250 RepID=A0A2I2FSX5_9EURO|nr:uncharacterized protein P170DRAFT_480687 [Aspergillus steynii IBT 23096]PLB43729.1 hypothetical protein P170DRAFT_480687 [Aspergillus steynii IBT 23096]